MNLQTDKAKPQNGTAKLDRATGQLTYAPNPGFIGEERFKYYTVDENNPQLGVENVVSVALSAEAFSKFDQIKPNYFSVEKVWKHSQRVAEVAKQISQILGHDASR